MRYRSTTRSTKKPLAKKQDLISARHFMCFAIHAVPDEALLSRIAWHKVGVYSPSWTKQGIRRIEKGNTCVAYLLRKSLSLLPLPQEIAADSAAYALGYDFFFDNQEKENDGELFIQISRWQGFVIATLPSHDWKRALSFQEIDRPSEALLYADRAIVNLASLKSDATLQRMEKNYKRFEKCRDLFIDQNSTPEGFLAFQFAMKQAGVCYSQLREGN